MTAWEASAAAAGSGQGLLADVDGQPEVGSVGSRDQFRPLGGGDSHSDRLAGIFGGGSSGTALHGFDHGSRIGDTETLDKGRLSCHGNCMTTATVLLIQTDDGNTIAVNFPSASAARDWEDEHEMELGTVIGTARVVTKKEALRRG